jgi:hypothetical protein
LDLSDPAKKPGQINPGGASVHNGGSLLAWAVDTDSGEKAFLDLYCTYYDLLPLKLMGSSELIYGDTFNCTAVRIDGKGELGRRAVHVDAP